MQVDNEKWVKGLFGLAFRFNGDDVLRATRCNKAGGTAWNLDVKKVTMVSWVRPQQYDIAYNAQMGIIMNKEKSYVCFPPQFSATNLLLLLLLCCFYYCEFVATSFCFWTDANGILDTYSESLSLQQRSRKTND